MSRGGYLHNHILLDPIEASFLARGASASREYPVKLERRLGFVDLFILLGCLRIALEAELSPKRVNKDVEKAAALQVHWLLIVTPRQRVAQACERLLLGIKPRPNFPIIFLTVGTALEWIANDFQKETHQIAMPPPATQTATKELPPHRSLNSRP